MANDARRAHVDDVLTNISAQISCPFQIASQAVAFQAILRMVRVLMKGCLNARSVLSAHGINGIIPLYYAVCQVHIGSGDDS